MNNIGNRLRQAGMNIIGAIQRFMAGRYGSDRLNITMLVVGCVLCFVQMFVPSGAGFVLTILSEALLILSLFRCFSRNTYKRRAENNAYLTLRYNMTRKLSGLKQRMQQKKYYRFYKCPKCGITTRVPKGKGKIRITCPKCGESFIRKS